MTIQVILALLALVPMPPAERALPEKPAQQMALAASLAEHARDADELAFLIAWGSAETNFAVRIHAGRCKSWECDRGKARGPWQSHRSGMRADDWSRMHGVENTPAQVARAAGHARWALRQCPGDRIRGAFRVLGGLRCNVPLKGEDERVVRFETIRGRL